MNFIKWLLKSRVHDIAGPSVPEAATKSAPGELVTLLQPPVDQIVNPIRPELEANLRRLEQIFKNCVDLVYLPWSYGPEMGYRAFTIYYDTLVQNKTHNYFKEVLQDMVTHIVGTGTMVMPDEIFSYFEHHGASSQSALVIEDFDTAVDHVLKGHLVIFFDHWNKALSYKARDLEKRQVSEPSSEPVVQGPKEGTIEDLQTNLGLLRARLKSSNFKIVTFSLQGETKTTIAYGYLDGTVDPNVLAEYESRISKLHAGEILEASYIEEFLEDSTFSPFPQCRYTERPDVAVAALLEGKIVTLVDGTGSILICPSMFVELLQSSEDYYQRTVISSLIRIMRVFAFFIALMLPSVYIALSTFHPELIPTVLLLAILNTREGIPFPAIFEALIMEFFFELLREAGVRLPRPVGSAVSIVGALVIGEASIRAGIASPMMVIIVALTGIASFSLAQFSFATALRVLRFPLMIFSAFLGGFGMMIALLLIWLHLANLRPLGKPYLSPLAPFHLKQLRDVLIRAPLQVFIRSPRRLHLRKTRL